MIELIGLLILFIVVVLGFFGIICFMSLVLYMEDLEEWLKKK